MGPSSRQFQNGVLRWLPTEDRAEIRTANEVGAATALDAKRGRAAAVVQWRGGPQAVVRLVVAGQ